jgi:hypothetical protein
VTAPLLIETPIDMDITTEVYYMFRASRSGFFFFLKKIFNYRLLTILCSLVTKLEAIIVTLQGLEGDIDMTASTSLREFFEELCEESPGVVPVRQSFDVFQNLASLDLRNYKIAHGNRDMSSTAPKT